MTKKINIAVLLSGSGRTLANFIDLIEQGKLPATIQVVISSKKSAYGLEIAKKNNIPAYLVERKVVASTEEFSSAINDILSQYPIDLICLAGFIHLYRISPQYEGRVMNIHPALLPNFGGKGYYGERVHQAVLQSGAKFSGCSVHLADNTYDTGPIILQKKVPVLENDTVKTLAQRVFEAEKETYPEAIRLFAKKIATTDEHR
ncbi:MAG: phosphoribosylglycinamide formyltransferase [Planctomycetota bacterium]|nr:phosphoribosylglycinamide formyltransferase [Planctomycetota bacterium]MDI6787180.1 phosphoribosylglycinamide formyltransferase [Planctomycetota bacterium]